MRLFLALHDSWHHGWRADVITEKEAESYADDEENGSVYPVEIEVDELPHTFFIYLDHVAPYQVTIITGLHDPQGIEFTITKSMINEG